MKNLVDIDNWDKEVINLCLALNKFPEIKTTSSCCGHGKDPIRIWLQVENIPTLSVFGWAGCFRHWCWRGNWNLLIDLSDPNCTGKHISLLLESTDMGQTAYEKAEKMAKGIEKFLSERKK